MCSSLCVSLKLSLLSEWKTFFSEAACFSLEVVFEGWCDIFLFLGKFRS